MTLCLIEVKRKKGKAGFRIKLFKLGAGKVAKTARIKSSLVM